MPPLLATEELLSQGEFQMVLGLVLRSFKGDPSEQLPWVGFTVQDARGRLAIRDVAPEGPAAQAGLQAGDCLVTLGDTETSTSAAFCKVPWGEGW